MRMTVTLTEAETAAVTAEYELAAHAGTLEDYAVMVIRHHVLAPMVDRHRQARTAAVVTRLRQSIEALARLPLAKQVEIQAMVEQAIAEAQGPRGSG